MPAVAAVSLALPAAVSAQPDWKEYTWKAGGCSVLLPGAPTEQTRQVGGGQTVHLLSAEVGKVAYVLSYAETPKLAKATAEDIEKAFAHARDQAVTQFKGKVIGEAERKLNGHPGREILIEAPGLGVYRVRLYLVGPRLYQVIVLGPREVALGKESDRYLDSFRLTK
jgi:hypothetical protein